VKEKSLVHEVHNEKVAKK